MKSKFSYQNCSEAPFISGKTRVPQSDGNTFSTGASSSVEVPAASSGRQGQVLKLKSVIKANFVILSRSRFKVQMSYDAAVIEIFKKMKTRSYGKLLIISLELSCIIIKFASMRNQI